MNKTIVKSLNLCFSTVYTSACLMKKLKTLCKSSENLSIKYSLPNLRIDPEIKIIVDPYNVCKTLLQDILCPSKNNVLS